MKISFLLIWTTHSVNTARPTSNPNGMAGIIYRYLLISCRRPRCVYLFLMNLFPPRFCAVSIMYVAMMHISVRTPPGLAISSFIYLTASIQKTNVATSRRTFWKKFSLSILSILTFPIFQRFQWGLCRNTPWISLQRIITWLFLQTTPIDRAMLLGYEIAIQFLSVYKITNSVVALYFTDDLSIKYEAVLLSRLSER